MWQENLPKRSKQIDQTLFENSDPAIQSATAQSISGSAASTSDGSAATTTTSARGSMFGSMECHVYQNWKNSNAKKSCRFSKLLPDLLNQEHGLLNQMQDLVNLLTTPLR